MVSLIDLIPDADVVCALEPEELGLRMLPALASWHSGNQLTMDAFVQRTVNMGGDPQLRTQYPRQRGGVEIQQAILEAWAWLEGAALLIEHPSYRLPHPVRMLSRRGRQLAAEP